MATYFMFGKYSAEALRGVSEKRTTKVLSIIKKLGGHVKDLYALLGSSDLVLIVELPGTVEAMKASLAIGQLTGIGFTTSPAIQVEDFDKLATTL